jgi:predicted nucleic acid-binding protein
MPREWDLRQALSEYDATYVALAEAFGLAVLTCDGRLARSHGGSADVHLV